MKTVNYIALLFICLFLSSSVAAGEHYYLISHAGIIDPFWNVPFNGAKAAADETGVKLTILAPEKVNDYNRQLELLQSAIEEKPAGIATTVTDPDVFANALKTARKKNIPIIAFNARPIEDDRIKNPYLAYIGMDDYMAGRHLAMRVLARNDTIGKVLVAIQQAGHTGLEARLRGISEVLHEKSLPVDRLNIPTENKSAMEKFRRYISSHPDITTVLTLGPVSAHSIGRVIKRDNLDLYFASFDITPLIIRMIKDKILDFSIDQQPYMQGYLSIKMLRLAAKYKMSPPDINTGIGIVDLETVTSVEQLTKKNIR